MSESMLKRVLSAIRGKLVEEPAPAEGHLSKAEQTAILESFAKQDALMERFENEEISVDEVERELRRIEIQRMADQAKADLGEEEAKSTVKLSASTKAIITKAISEALPTIEEPPKKSKPKPRRFKFDGRIAWAWEIENSVANMDDLNALLVANKKASEEGQAMAEDQFERMAKFSTDETFKQHMDEDGADVLLPNIPYSPYTDEGAAFMVSLAYAWRSMAEEWNMVELQRQKEQKDKEAKERADELSEYLRTSVDEMIKTELARKEAMKDRNDELDARAFERLTVKPTDFAKIFDTSIASEESFGVSKIAAGLRMGQLPKSKF